MSAKIKPISRCLLPGDAFLHVDSDVAVANEKSVL